MAHGHDSIVDAVNNQQRDRTDIGNGINGTVLIINGQRQRPLKTGFVGRLQLNSSFDNASSLLRKLED